MNEDNEEQLDSLWIVDQPGFFRQVAKRFSGEEIVSLLRQHPKVNLYDLFLSYWRAELSDEKDENVNELKFSLPILTRLCLQANRENLSELDNSESIEEMNGKSESQLPKLLRNDNPVIRKLAVRKSTELADSATDELLAKMISNSEEDLFVRREALIKLEKKNDLDRSLLETIASNDSEPLALRYEAARFAWIAKADFPKPYHEFSIKPRSDWVVPELVVGLAADAGDKNLDETGRLNISLVFSKDLVVKGYVSSEDPTATSELLSGSENLGWLMNLAFEDGRILDVPLFFKADATQSAIAYLTVDVKEFEGQNIVSISIKDGDST